MKAVLKYSLFRRLSHTNEVPANGFLPKDSVIEVEDIVQGKAIDNISTWYKAKDGFYYWGGGIENPNANKPIADYKMFLDYLPSDWLDIEMPNSQIIVIDTGISISKFIFDERLCSEITLVDDVSKNRDHGTFIAGIIGSKGVEISGITTGVRILGIRYKNINTGLSEVYSNLLIALKKVKDLNNANPDIRFVINISQGFNKFQTSLFPEKIAEIISLITSLSALNILFFCAAGDDNDLLEDNLLFPANLSSVISVGCLSKGKTELKVSKKIDVVSKLEEYKSYNSNFNVVPDSGSSFSVAFVTAIAAQLKANRRLSKDEVMNLLSPFSCEINDFNFSSQKYQFSLQKK